MRQVAAQIMEVCGAGAVVAAAYLQFGLAAALALGGLALIAASLVVGR